MPIDKTVLARLSILLHQPSTWRGLVVLLAGCGVALKPHESDAIIAGGLIVAGLIAVFVEK